MSVYARYAAMRPQQRFTPPINQNAMLIANQAMVDKNYSSIYQQDLPHRTQFLGLMSQSPAILPQLYVGGTSQLVGALSNLIASGMQSTPPQVKERRKDNKIRSSSPFTSHGADNDDNTISSLSSDGEDFEVLLDNAMDAMGRLGHYLLQTMGG